MKFIEGLVKPLATATLGLTLLGYVLARPASTSTGDDAHHNFALSHATNIFNSIHSAMRQWDSSVHHNGMTFFLATIPEGIQFYHGRASPERLTGLEWLAFEAEHAMGFATPPNFFPAPPPDDGFDDDDPSLAKQQPMGDLHKADDQYGYLHTYVTNKELRLLYIDGMAAAKTNIGPMDAENVILLNNTFPPGRRFVDFEKALHMCDISRNEWDGRIHGFIRMEAGFELILCSFDDDVDKVRITASKLPRTADTLFDEESNHQYLKALASRYDGVGKDVVRLNFEHFVTAYNYGFDLFSNGQQLPRLTNLSASDIARIRHDTWGLAKYGEVSQLAFDWQGVSDKIVLRYADAIESLAQGTSASNQSFFQKIEVFLQPFIEYDLLENGGDKVNETMIDVVAERCAEQFIPRSAPRNTLPGTAVYSVSRKICSTFSSVFFRRNSEGGLSNGLQEIRSLMSELDWPVWKKCRGCGVDEVCMIPMWPFGDKTDYDHPRCHNITDFSWWGDYWGPMTN